MAADICEICGEWYVSMLPLNGMCRLCEMRERQWRDHIAQQLEQMLLKAWYEGEDPERLIHQAIEIARGLDA